MYKQLVVPIDLAHTEKLEKALTVAADLANHFDARVNLVGLTAPTPDPVSHNAEEYRSKLEEFAAKQSASLGVKFSPHTIVTADPVTELEPRMDEYIHEIGADLVIMATHTDVSVFAVR